MQIEAFAASDINDISELLLHTDRKIKLLSSEFYRNLRWADLRVFCHKYGRYGIPTTELINYIDGIIDGRPAIEIGAGVGDLGAYLHIPMTDNKQQQWPHIAERYKAMMQPTINYPDDVEEIDALDAVIKYKPKVVVASWITPYSPHEVSFGSNPHGVKESEILDLVDTFIIIGNLDTHGDKPILKQPHEELYFDWLVSRGRNQENNRIFIWNKK